MKVRRLFMKTKSKFLCAFLGVSLLFGGLVAFVSHSETIKLARAEDEPNATYTSIYSDTWNNTTFAGNADYNQILFKYSGTGHGDASDQSYYGADVLDKILLNGSALNTYGGSCVRTWGGANYIYIIYPKTAVSEGSTMEISSGIKIGNSIFNRFGFKLNSSEKWDNFISIDGDDLVKNSDYKLFTLSDYPFASNDTNFFYSSTECVDAMEDSFGFRLNVNIPSAQSPCNGVIKFSGTNIYGSSPIFQITLDYTNNVFLTFNGTIDWSTSIVHSWSINVNHLVEIYFIKTSETTAKVLLGIDGELIFKSADKSLEGLTFHNYLLMNGQSTPSFYSAVTDTTGKAVNRFINKYVNNASATYQSAKSCFDKYLTAPQQQYFLTDDSCAAARTAYYGLAGDYVESLISAIGEVTLAKEEQIQAVRAAYDALPTEAKPLVDNYSTLTAAESALADIKAAKAAAQVVDNQIAAIGEVMLEKEDAIVAARAAYEALSDDAKGFIENLATLTAAEATLAELKAAAAALLAYKNDAKTELANYVNSDNYREAEQNQLETIISNGNTAIDSAIDYDGVDTALANSKASIDDLKTKAEYEAEELATLLEAKTQAKEELANYKDLSLYREQQKQEIADIIANGNNTIDAATSIQGVDEALDTIKALLDAVKTDAQLVLEEAKTAAKNELVNYKNPNDYRENEKSQLETIVAYGSSIIDSASNTDEIITALRNAKAQIDTLKTKSQYETEETFEERKQSAKVEITNYYNNLVGNEEYTESNAALLLKTKQDIVGEIEDATSVEEIEEIVTDGKAAMDAIEKVQHEEKENAEPTNKNGCKGSIIATSATISLLSILGFGFSIFKKKQD